MNKIKKTAIAVTGCLITVCFCLPVDLSAWQEETEKESKRPEFMDQPMDFSDAPEIMEPIEGPSPSEIQRS